MVNDSLDLKDLQSRAAGIVSMLHCVLDENHKLVKVSPEEHIAWWVRAHSVTDFRSTANPSRVGWDSIQGVEVSTVFLMGPSPGSGAEYCYFESMVSTLDDELHGEPQYRYVTWDDAEDGHGILVKLVNELMARPKELRAKELPPHE